MAVTIRLFAAARAAAGVSELQGGSGTLQSILDALTAEHPALLDVLPRCSFLVDGTATHGDPAEVSVEDGAEVDVLPPFAGG